MAPSDALRVLLGGAVDYAGLFPPAALPLSEVLARYASYRTSPQAWALGRLVLPAARLREVPTDSGHELSILLADDEAPPAAEDGRRVAALETAAPTPEAVEAVAATLKGAGVPVYVEVPPRDDLDTLLAAVRRAGLRAKARAGGVTAEAIPPPASVLRFLEACFEAGLRFKLTAGLHHAVRGSHPLTYEVGSPCGTMHGFLNVFAAAALLAAGVRVDESILNETDARAFAFDDEGLAWRERRADLAAIARARALLVSFGSCSFEEPLSELEALGLA